MKIPFLLSALAAAFLAASCDTFTLTDQFEKKVAAGEPEDPGNELALELSSTEQLLPGDSIVLTASGGTPPYTFSTRKGNTQYAGSTPSAIDGSVFTAGDSIGTEYIMVTDSAAQSANATVTIGPPAPTGFVADGTIPGNNTILLTWDAPAHKGITGFRIERTIPTSFATPVEVDKTTTSHVDTGANPNLNTYRLYALAGSYQSDYVEASATGRVPWPRLPLHRINPRISSAAAV